MEIFVMPVVVATENTSQIILTNVADFIVLSRIKICVLTGYLDPIVMGMYYLWFLVFGET